MNTDAIKRCIELTMRDSGGTPREGVAEKAEAELAALVEAAGKVGESSVKKRDALVYANVKERENVVREHRLRVEAEAALAKARAEMEAMRTVVEEARTTFIIHNEVGFCCCTYCKIMSKYEVAKAGKG